ncbi:response regulator [Bacillus timonensis]|nr:response regulator [Bacillus timonensis]
MKILLIDDESHVREGIKILGEWEQLGIHSIFEADNGEEALTIIHKEKPSIIMTDMKMPKLNGIQLLEWLNTENIQCKTIVLTGYDDYQYMRKAIQFGATDYLLKPIDPDMLNQTLVKSIQELKQEAKERKERIYANKLFNEAMTMYRDRTLTALLQPSHSVPSAVFKELPAEEIEVSQAVIVTVGSAVFSHFSHDRDLTYFTLLNIINEIVVENRIGIAFRNLSNKGEIVIIYWASQDRINEYMERIYKAIEEVVGHACVFAIGNRSTFPTELYFSYMSAVEVIQNRNLLDYRNPKIYDQSFIEDKGITTIIDYTHDIEVAIQSGDMKEFQSLFRKVLDHQYVSIKQLLHWEKEYEVLKGHWLQKYEIQQGMKSLAIEQFFDKKGDFQFADYVNEKKQEVEFFLKQIQNSQFSKERNVICEIAEYIQHNYDKDLKLQEISERFYLSREYISRKFKQQYNQNMSDYLVSIRMNKAKSLLKNEQLKIYEIANLIGYQDDKYFRKVFKKQEGITPNDYRANILVNMKKND